MTGDAHGKVHATSSSGQVERARRIRVLVPLVVLVLAAVRALAAMLVPWVRAPGWPDVMLLIIAAVGAVYLFVTGPPDRARVWAAAAAAAFWLMPCASAMIHDQTLSPATAAMAAVAVVLIAGPADSPVPFRAAIVSGAVIVVLSLGYGILSATGTLDGAFHTVGEYERTTLGVPALRGITLHPNTLGPIAALTLFLSASMALSARKAGAWLIPALSLVALAWSQSRSAIIGALIAGVGWMVVTRWNRTRAPVIGLALLVAVAPVIAIYMSLPAHLPLDEWFTGRPLAWDTGLTLFSANPWAGYGPDSFSKDFWAAGQVQSWQPLHAHNQVIEVAAQAGFLGLASLAALVVAGVAAALHRAGRAGRLAVAVIALTAVQGATEVPLGLTYFPISYLFPTVLVAALAYVGNGSGGRDEPRPPIPTVATSP